jgi:hypothetical protein
MVILLEVPASGVAPLLARFPWAVRPETARTRATAEA